jgi:hypothetical protein
MATYDNDLRLKEITTGDESGTWGTSTNVNLELIAEAFSYGTEASFSSDADATTTIADGATDPARSLYFKVTSGVSLTATRTLTLAPNDVSKIWIIENATTGGQSISISQGSGANITIPAGDTKVVYSDGAGAGAAFFDAFASLSVVDLTATGIVTAAGTSVFTNLDISGDVDVDGTLETDNLTVGGAQGTDGQVLTSTGSGVAWEAGGATDINGLSDAKTFGTSSIMLGDATTGTIDGANYNVGLGVDVFSALTSGDSNIAIGFDAADTLTTGSFNVAIGTDSLGAAGSGVANNIMIGYNTGYGLTGDGNVAIGHTAFDAAGDRDGCVAIGNGALTTCTTGSYNVAVGDSALYANTEGASNVAIGEGVLVACTTGGTNVAIGYHAGDSITTAGGNVFIGTNAGQSATTSIYPNIGIGTNAMYSITDGYQNIAIGYRAGESCTAIGNTFMGDSAGMQVTTGNGNVCYGLQLVII